MNKMVSLMGRSKWVVCVALITWACGGVASTASSETAGAGGAAQSVPVPASAGARGVSRSVTKVAEAGAGGESGSVAVAPEVDAGGDTSPPIVNSEAGSGGGDSSSSGGAQPIDAGGTSAAGWPTAGAGGAHDPECAPTNQHALPAKCGPQPVECLHRYSYNGIVSGYFCTGTGVCLSSNPSGQSCDPDLTQDYVACSDGRTATCDKGTCGTDAGFKCALDENVYPVKFCPCVHIGQLKQPPTYPAP